MKNYIIYKLVSSEFPEEIRYIGITTQTIKKRFYHHKYNATNPNKRNQPVHKWMYSVYQKGFDVIISQIDSCSQENWEEKEKFYIEKYRIGGKLLNISNGGCGVVTKEMRNKSGINRSIDAHKISIVALDKNGNFFKEFNSLKESTNYFNLNSDSSINNALKGRSKTCQGYIWIYKKDYINNNYNNQINPDPRGITFNQFDLQGNFVKKWNSKRELLNNSNKTSLNNALKNQTIYKNSYWSYNNQINIKI